MYLEPPVVFGDGVGEVDALPLGQELAQLRPLLHAQVITHEIPVDAVPPPLFEVVEDAGGWKDPEEGQVGQGSVLVAQSPPNQLWFMAARSGACFMSREESQLLELGRL